MNAAYGIGWHIGRRHRFGLSVLAVGFAALVILRNIPNIGTGPIVGASLWFVIGLLYLLAVFTQPDVDITASGSGYPQHLFVLPVRTYQLVLWPMLFGVCMVGLGWVGLSTLILNSGEFKQPILWPACLIGAALATLQALFWAPMRFPQIRLIATFALLVAMVYVGAFTGSQLNATQRTLGFLLVIPVAFAYAVYGVAKARMSEVTVKKSEVENVVVPAKIRAPFSSANAGQGWYERRRVGIALPIIFTVVGLIFSAPIYFNPELQNMNGMPVEANAYVYTYMPGLVRIMIFLAWIVGCSVRLSGARLNGLALPAFVAMRPISTHQMVMARFRARFWTSAIATVALLAILFCWLFTTAKDPHGETNLISALAGQMNTRDWITAGIGVLLVFGLTLRCMLVGQFATLSGRSALAYGYMGFAIGAPVMFMAIFNQGMHSSESAFITVFWIAIGIKAIGASVALTSLYQRRLYTIQQLIAFVAVWAIVAYLFYCALVRLEASTTGFSVLLAYRDVHEIGKPLYFALIAIFYTPLVRLALAPLAMSANRSSA